MNHINGTYDLRTANSPDFEGEFAVPMIQVAECLLSILECKYAIDNAYRSFADRTPGPWRDALVEHWTEHAKEERQHAYDIAMRLYGLGVDPNITQTTIPMVQNGLDNFCSALIQMELDLIHKARLLCELAGSNTALKVLGENIALVDTQHLDDLRRMCGL